MSSNKKSKALNSEVVADMPVVESVLVNQPNGTTEVLPATDETADTQPSEASQVEVEKVVKITVPKKVEAAKLDDYDTQLINLVLGSNLLGQVIEARENAPKLKAEMVVKAKADYSSVQKRFMALASEVIEPDSPEEMEMEEIVISKRNLRQEIAKIEAMDVSEIAGESLKAMRDSLTRDIEALRLSVFGRETENSGKPEGSPNSGKTFTWQSETTMSFWRNEKDLVIAPVSVNGESWLSFEYREEHGLQGNWFVAFERSTGKIAYKMWDVKSSSNLWFKLTSQILVEKGEEEPKKDTWGNNQTSMGSTTTDAQKAKYPVLTPAQLRELVGDKGTSFAHNVSISEEVGQDDETARLTLGDMVEESKESVTA